MGSGKHAVSVRHFGSVRDKPVSDYYLTLDKVPNGWKTIDTTGYYYTDKLDQTDFEKFDKGNYKDIWNAHRTSWTRFLQRPERDTLNIHCLNL